jgi:hypothetical protein
VGIKDALRGTRGAKQPSWTAMPHRIRQSKTERRTTVPTEPEQPFRMATSHTLIRRLRCGGQAERQLVCAV